MKKADTAITKMVKFDNGTQQIEVVGIDTYKIKRAIIVNGHCHGFNAPQMVTGFYLMELAEKETNLLLITLQK